MAFGFSSHPLPFMWPAWQTWTTMSKSLEPWAGRPPDLCIKTQNFVLPALLGVAGTGQPFGDSCRHTKNHKNQEPHPKLKLLLEKAFASVVLWKKLNVLTVKSIHLKICSKKLKLHQQWNVLLCHRQLQGQESQVKVIAWTPPTTIWIWSIASTLWIYLSVPDIELHLSDGAQGASFVLIFGVWC